MNAVEVRNLSKAYKNFSLNDISFTLPSGYILGLIGRNGSGKSTLIDMLCGIVRPDAGKIKIMGCDINDSAFSGIKEHIGYVTSAPSFPYFFTPKEINKILRATYATWNEDKFFECLRASGLNPEQKLKTYSHGMYMALQIAVALSHDTKLLLFDEATNGLDDVIRGRVNDMLMEFTEREDRSVIITSHISSDLDKICDFVAYLVDGSLRFFEEKDALFEKFSIVKCTAAELAKIDADAVVGTRISEFGAEALVETRMIPKDTYTERATIEDIIFYTQKEEDK